MALNKSVAYRKWDILIVDLNPVRGSEISKTRPCLVVSPGPMNEYLNTIIVVPFTSAEKGYPFRLSSTHKNVPGELCFDQIKSLDKSRVVKKAGNYPEGGREIINEMLMEVFGEE